MHIVLIVSALQPSNKESLAITTLNFARKLIQGGHEVTIVSRNKWGLPACEKKEGITFLRTKRIGRSAVFNKLLAFPWAIRKLAKRSKIDVIHGFSAAPLLVLRSLLAAKLFVPNASIVHSLKSYPIKRDVSVKSGSKLWSRLGDISYRLLNHVDAVTVPTRIFAEKLCQKRVKREKVHLVRSHIDLSKFFPQQKEGLRQKHGYSGKKIVFNYGAMWEIKGTDCLIKSIPYVIKEHPDTLFVFAPRNFAQAKQKYFPLLQELGVSEYVHFIEEDIPIEEYVNMADVVAIPYPHLEGTEGNPSCLLEAIACGTPVVTTSIAEIMEVFAGCALLVEPNDPKALAQAVNVVLSCERMGGGEDPKSDGVCVEKLVSNGLEMVGEYGVGKITDKCLAIYRRV